MRDRRMRRRVQFERRKSLKAEDEEDEVEDRKGEEEEKRVPGLLDPADVGLSRSNR